MGEASPADRDGDGIWTEYLHRDHQGSLVAISDAEGAVLARFSYDAWGKRRAAVDWSEPGPGAFLQAGAHTTRGYTGHEHLDHVGLIHMNGRVYAPGIGRFFSADPYVQFPESTQGLNRYAYVGNNPLSYTDPSGHFIVAALAAVAATYAENVIVAAVIGAVSGYLTTGTLEGALLGAASAAVGFEIGHATGWTFVAKAVAHGLSQGAITDIAGGKFANGLKSALVGSILQKVPLPKGPLGAVVAAAIGGTISDIGGGNFANGARTAAFVYAFGDKGKKQKPADPLDQALDHLSDSETFNELYAEAKKHGVDVIVDPNAPRTWFDHEANKIIWNPTQSIRTSAGVSSAALGLAHEFAHAVRFHQVGADQFLTDLTAPILESYYDSSSGAFKVVYGVSPEEARATRVEQIIGRELGEPVRASYLDSSTVNVSSPTFYCFTGTPGC